MTEISVNSMKDRIAQVMKLRGISVADLVRATDMSKSGIHFILNGTTKSDHIRAVNIDKVARALAVSRDWLLYGENHGDVEAQDARPPLVPSVDMLAGAVSLMTVDETIGGKYSSNRHAGLLLELCDRIANGEPPQELAAWLAYQRNLKSDH